MRVNPAPKKHLSNNRDIPYNPPIKCLCLCPFLGSLVIELNLETRFGTLEAEFGAEGSV